MVEHMETEAVITRVKRGARWKRKRHQRELGRRARQEKREKRRKKGAGGAGNNKNRNQKGGSSKKKHNRHKNKGGGGGKGGNHKKGGGGGGKNKNILIPNKHGVKIRSFGEIQLFDLATDPAEKVRSN